MEKQYKVNIFNIVKVNTHSGAAAALLFLALFPLGAGLSYLAVAALSFGLCWGFSLPWSWQIATGLWCGTVLLKIIVFLIFQTPNNND